MEIPPRFLDLRTLNSKNYFQSDLELNNRRENTPDRFLDKHLPQMGQQFTARPHKALDTLFVSAFFPQSQSESFGFCPHNHLLGTHVQALRDQKVYLWQMHNLYYSNAFYCLHHFGLATNDNDSRWECSLKFFTLYFLGAIKTEIGRYSGFWWRLVLWPIVFLLFVDSESGAQTTLHCALEQGIEQFSGHYFSECTPQVNIESKARDDASAKKLWELSESFCGLA